MPTTSTLTQILPPTLVSSLPSSSSSIHNDHTGIIYPNHVAQSLVGSGYLIALCITTVMVKERVPSEFSLSSWRNMSWARVATILCLLDSWLFVFVAAFLVLGVGVSYSKLTCEFAVWLCIVSYAGSKVFIYLFLLERVYIIHGPGRTRLSTWSYRIGILIIPAWVTILVLMIIGRNAFFRSDGVCVIGLREIATIPLMIQDFGINVYLTSMFVIPIARGEWKNPRLRAYAKRSLFSAVAALATSLTNLLMVAILKGHQLGWVCLGSCGLDVFMNAAILFHITSRKLNINPEESLRHRFQNTTFALNAANSAASKVFLTYETDVDVASRPKRLTYGRRDSIENPEARMMDIAVLGLPQKELDIDIEDSLREGGDKEDQPPFKNSGALSEVQTGAV